MIHNENIIINMLLFHLCEQISLNPTHHTFK